MDLEEPAVVRELADATLTSDDWSARRQAARGLARYAASSSLARRTLAEATHDPVDKVAFECIRLCGDLHITEAVEHLIKISGWPSNFTRPETRRKPVGIGAALTKNALIRLFDGVADPALLRRAEDQFFAEMRRGLAEKARQPDLTEAVYVPGGPFIAGIQEAPDDTAFRMDVSDHPSRVVILDGFWIDRDPVTNARYAEFLKDVGETRDFAHPDEPPGKRYLPVDWNDPRFNGPHKPVVGIDWYDAYAFAKWAGGALPSEDEWEKAARGTDGRIYPFGAWNPEHVNYVERSFGRPVTNQEELEQLILEISDSHPAEPVLDVGALPGNVSPYGARQMSGNVWEITRTNYFTRRDMAPFFRAYRPSEFLHRPEAFHVLRGGTWTSPPICLRADYRGRDLLTDKHFEVGFRCVYYAPPPDTSEAANESRLCVFTPNFSICRCAPLSTSAITRCGLSKPSLQCCSMRRTALPVSARHL